MSTYLIKRAEHFHYRRAVPTAWRDLLGRREWKQALKVSSRVEAEAKAREIAVEHDKLLAELQAKGSDLVAKERHDEILQTFDDQKKDIFKWFQGTELSDEDESKLYRELARLEHTRRAKTKALGIKPNPRAVAEAFLRYGYEGEFGKDTSPPTDDEERDEWEAEKLKLERKITRLAPEQNKLSTIAEDWHRFAGHSPETRRKYTANLERFKKVSGDLPIDQITRAHIIRYRDDLVDSGVAATTVRKYLDTLNALFRWARREPQLIQINPAEDVRPPRDTRPSDKMGRWPFSAEELKNILAQAKAQWSKQGRERDILMMLRVLIYTGARPEEIAQLRPSDVKDGVIYINDEDGKMIKNKASIRKLPIHPAIEDFETFAKSSDKLVFKSFESIQGRKAGALSDRFSNLIRKQLKITDQRKTLYSVRHSFADACRNAGLAHGTQYQLMGHVENNRNAAGYGTGASIETLKRELAKVDPLQ